MNKTGQIYLRVNDRSIITKVSIYKLSLYMKNPYQLDIYRFHESNNLSSFYDPVVLL